MTFCYLDVQQSIFISVRPIGITAEGGCATAKDAGICRLPNGTRSVSEDRMFKHLQKALKRLHSDETGAMSVEKVLILALIALPILIVLFLFREKIMEWFNGQEQQLKDPGTGNLP